MSWPSSQAQRVARNFTWLSLQEAVIRIVGLVLAVYLARTLSPASYGELGLALAIVAIATTQVQAGTGSRATRQTALNPGAVPDIHAQLIGFRLTVAAVAIVALLAMAPLLSELLSFPTVLLGLCALLLLRPALTVVWAFRGLDQMHVTAIADMVEKVLTLLGVVLLVRGQGNDVLWAPVVEVAAGLLMVVWLRRRLSQGYPGLAIEFRTHDWPDIAREAMPLGLAALMASLSLHGPILLLGWLSTAESAAGFLVAQKVMLTFAALVIVINRAAFPSTSRLLTGDSADALALLANLLRYYLVMIAPMFVLIAFFAEPFLVWLFGAEYAGTGLTLIVLLVALPFLALNHFQLFLLRALPRPRWVLITRIVGAVVLLPLAVVLIPRAGMPGAAMAYVGSEIAAMALLLFVVREATGGLPLNLRCAGPIVAGAAAALAYWLAVDWPVLLSLPLAVFVYVAGVLLTGGVTVDELRALPELVRRTVREPTQSKSAN